MNKKLKRDPEIVKESLKAISELEDQIKLENVIKDNKIEFRVGEERFGVRKPNLDEQEEVSKKQRLKYTELVQDDTMFFRKEWIKRYKVKGIDINKMENDILVKQSEVEKLLLQLAEVEDKKSVHELKETIQQLRDEQYRLSIEKTELLNYSIEDQLLQYVNAYTTYLVLEKKIEEKWERAFESYKDFMASNNADLIQKAFYFINVLIYQK